MGGYVAFVYIEWILDIVEITCWIMLNEKWLAYKYCSGFWVPIKKN
jgi:hypothetical protein